VTLGICVGIELCLSLRRQAMGVPDNASAVVQRVQVPTVDFGAEKTLRRQSLKVLRFVRICQKK
jgi:hypothetical protein